MPGDVVGLGLDLVDIARFGAVLERRRGMAERLFARSELHLVREMANPRPTLAGRFAVKEAVMKALGVGLGAVDWTDIVTTRHPGGAPLLELSGRAAALAEARQVQAWQVSISHTDTVAAAVVLALGAR